MSVKKLLILSAAGLAAVGATAVLAGGPDQMAMPAEPAFQPSVYVDAHVGYAQSNWKDFNANGVIGTSADSAFAPTTNKLGGWTGGLDLGYNFTQHIAAEAGWFYLPRVSAGVTSYGTATVGVASATTAKVRSWFAYAAAKISAAVMDNLDLYGKVGFGYRSLDYSVPGSPASLVAITGDGHYWSPLLATGIQYTWDNSWLFGAQYTHLTGNSNANYGSGPSGTGAGYARLAGAPNAAPDVNMYTAFVGYKFVV